MLLMLLCVFLALAVHAIQLGLESAESIAALSLSLDRSLLSVGTVPSTITSQQGIQ